MIRWLCAALLAVAHPLPAQTVSPLTFGRASAGDAIQYAAPTTGQTVVMASGMSALVLDNAALLATLTVTLPAAPFDGQRVTIASGNGVTALTINGGTVKGTVATLTVNGFARFIYSATAAAWFRAG